MLVTGVALPILAMIVVVTHASQSESWPSVASFGLLLALAAFTLGSLMGFLFGIPKAIQQPDVSNPAVKPGRYMVNTNLEQISDWLTKILVGVGLVQLSQLPHAIGRLSSVVAPGLGDGQVAAVVAGVVMVLFAALGFVFSYVLTRTYLTAAFRDFDDAAVDRIRTTLRALNESLADAGTDPIRAVDALRPPSDGGVPPTHNREPLEEPLALTDDVAMLDIVSLSSRITQALARLVGPTAALHQGNSRALAGILINRGVLEPASGRAIEEFFDLLDATEPEVLEISTSLRDQAVSVLTRLNALASTAAALFEHHVLETLRHNAPPFWVITEDVGIGRRGEVIQRDGTPDSTAIIARIDALIDTGSSLVAVEVRARLFQFANVQLDSLRIWLRSLPEGLPVVLVVPNLRGEQAFLGQFLNVLDREYAVLEWDYDAPSLLSTINKLGRRSARLH